MPLDLNQYEAETLAVRIGELLPGQAIITNDGLAIRRRPTSPGYDCVIGRGGYGRTRKFTTVDAAEYLLSKSAGSEDPKSLGGGTRFTSPEEAIESVRKGEAKPAGPSPAAKALRRLVNNAGLHSYRVRGGQARDALAKGDIGRAVHQLEVIREHAGNNGRLKDVERAETALAAIRENHDVSAMEPSLDGPRVEIKVRDGKHYVYRDGVEVAGGISSSEALRRKAFLDRDAAKKAAVNDIDTEIKELPSALGEEPAAA